MWTISAVLAVVTALTGAEIALLFVAVGLLMIVFDAPPSWLRRTTPAAGVAWIPSLGPLAGKGLAGKALAAAAGGGTLLALGWFFVKAGAFIFGSGLAIVPFLREGVVHQHHWLSDGQFLDAVAMGLITPGPVVITATFIGYLVAGWPGAVVATVAIFTPIYLGVVLPGRWFIRHRDNAQIRRSSKAPPPPRPARSPTLWWCCPARPSSTGPPRPSPRMPSRDASIAESTLSIASGECGVIRC